MLVTLCTVSSAHCQLSPHDPQPGLTYSKHTATVLLKNHEQPLRRSPKAGFLPLSSKAKRKCPREDRSPESRTRLLCPPSLEVLLAGPSPDPCLLGRGMEKHGSLKPWRRFLTFGLTPKVLWDRGGGWLWRGAGTLQASCGPTVGCQRPDGTTLGDLKSPQTKVFRIVRELIQSPVFLLFSVAFGLGHKGLTEHSAEPGKSKGLKHLMRTRHFKKMIPCLGT